MAILRFRVLQGSLSLSFSLLLPFLAPSSVVFADSPQARNVESRELSVRELSFDEMLRESRRMGDSRQFDDEKSALWDKYRVAIQHDSARANAHKDRKIKDGDKTMRFSMEVKGERPANGYPLYIALHGGGGTSAVFNDMQWQDMQTYYLDGVENGIYVATRGVTDTWNLHFVDESYRLYDYLIENMIAFEGVDPNRVYILGFSAGGDGVYQITPRMPDRFAAANMSAGHHNWIKFDNLFQTPFLMQVGENDSAYKRNTVAVENHMELNRLHDLRGGYIHDVFVHYRGSHNSWADNDPDGREQRILAHPMEWLKDQDEDTVMKDTNAIHWLDQYARDPYPKKLVWDPDTNAPRSVNKGAVYLSEDALRNKLSQPRNLFYWLDVGPAKSIPEKIVMEASYDRDENEVRLSGLGSLDAIRVLVHPKMLDFSRDVTVSVDSQKVGRLTLNADRQIMARTLLERGDSNYIFPAEINLKQAEDGSWTIKE